MGMRVSVRACEKEEGTEYLVQRENKQAYVNVMMIGGQKAGSEIIALLCR